jgi:hypothetical protein
MAWPPPMAQPWSRSSAAARSSSLTLRKEMAATVRVGNAAHPKKAMSSRRPKRLRKKRRRWSRSRPSRRDGAEVVKVVLERSTQRQSAIHVPWKPSGMERLQLSSWRPVIFLIVRFRDGRSPRGFPLGESRPDNEQRLAVPRATWQFADCSPVDGSPLQRAPRARAAPLEIDQSGSNGEPRVSPSPPPSQPNARPGGLLSTTDRRTGREQLPWRAFIGKIPRRSP